MPHSLATAASSVLTGQRSGRSSPRVVGRRALERHAAGVVADRADLVRLCSGLSRCSAGRAASSARFSSIGRAPRAGLLDQGRDDALDRVVGEVPLAGELHRSEPGALGDRPQPIELRPALRDPALGPEGAMVALRQLHLRA